jgi:hypothetical protein
MAAGMALVSSGFIANVGVKEYYEAHSINVPFVLGHAASGSLQIPRDICDRREANGQITWHIVQKLSSAEGRKLYRYWNLKAKNIVILNRLTVQNVLGSSCHHVLP